MVTLITSQQVQDEKLEEQYLLLTQGKMSPNEMAAPLMRVDFFDYYSHLEKMMRQYSMQHKKTESLLSFICVILCKYRGAVPMDVNTLRAFPHVGTKKLQLYLRSVGTMTRLGWAQGRTHMSSNVLTARK